MKDEETTASDTIVGVASTDDAPQSPPSPTHQASRVREVYDEPLAEGRQWYVLCLRWWNLWAEHTKWDTANACHQEGESDSERRSISGPQSGELPPPIDNTNLTLRPTQIEPVDGGPLQRDLVQQRDFILIPEAAWLLLHRWYGGGPILKRSTICSYGHKWVELYPLALTLYETDASGHVQVSSAVELSVSRRKKVDDLLGEIRASRAPEVKSIEDLRLWHRPDPAVDQTDVIESKGWEIVAPIDYTLEDAGIQDGVSMLLEQRRPTKCPAPKGVGGTSEWPFYARSRQEYRASTFKDPHNKNGPPLTVGDEIDTSVTEGNSRMVWYPSTVIEESLDRVLVEFHLRRPPPQKIPDVTRLRYHFFGPPVYELTDEATTALRKVFEHYAAQNSRYPDQLDRRALGAIISRATNSVCTEDDTRVQSIMLDYTRTVDGRLSVSQFLDYYRKRASAPHFLKDELIRLYKRANVDFGSQSPEEKLLEECKEWLPRKSPRLAAFRTHVNLYPTVSSSQRDFRLFQVHDAVNMRVGKEEWLPARVIKVDWDDYSVLVERLASASSSVALWGSGGDTSQGPSPGAREWLPIESDRLARPDRKISGNDPSPKAARAIDVSGACEMPGACGLNNLGNTCFMNSVLQALSTTSPLREYYTSLEYKDDVSKTPLSMNGDLAHGFKELLNTMWADKHRACSPNKLKGLVSQRRPEFGGYQQHDAHELLTFLLDALHEDCNKASYPRPTVEDPDIDGKTEVQVAEEAWTGHLRRNRSRIVDTFQFQVRSEVTFPDVNERSLTFDPMMYLTLPLPKPPHCVSVTVMPLAWPEAAPMKCTFEIPKDQTFKTLEEKVLESFPARDGICHADCPRCFVFADVHRDHRIHKFYNNHQQLREIGYCANIWAFEVALEQGIPESSHDIWAVHLRRRTKKTQASSYYANGGTSSSAYSFNCFAPPKMFASEKDKTTCSDVHKRVGDFAEQLRKTLHSESQVSLTISPFAYVEGHPLATKPFRFRLEASKEVLSLNFHDELGVIGTKAMQSDGANSSALPEVAEGRLGPNMELRLEQCLEMFGQSEELAQEDWVYCSKTKAFERSLKKLDLWSLPKCLVVHLKRFGRETLVGPLAKIETLVQFPLHLDMAPWVRSPSASQGSTCYNLYAVVNHTGTLGFGHYTAYAKINDGTEKDAWFNFNDDHVTRIDASQVVTKAAYILFYEQAV